MIICSAWVLVRQDLISSVIPNYFVLSLDVSASMVSFGLKPGNISADTREKCFFLFFLHLGHFRRQCDTTFNLDVTFSYQTMLEL